MNLDPMNLDPMSLGPISLGLKRTILRDRGL